MLAVKERTNHKNGGEIHFFRRVAEYRVAERNTQWTNEHKKEQGQYKNKEPLKEMARNF
jgi:hypothetical protein